MLSIRRCTIWGAIMEDKVIGRMVIILLLLSFALVGWGFGAAGADKRVLKLKEEIFEYQAKIKAQSERLETCHDANNFYYELFSEVRNR